ncbi:uncharacterized protein MELLADRAFT_86389 [Melampsora larici-populina 98AG31]|uniref:Secreted protein n=1 Tax=Melampsora larici-populina (strain 98AG31 / pathotype 3-4-7) TaxID=747676 RepID=F4RLM3_MELLP|nr:uncharacterized protein MELLADRAFT_86389 [Melampsora larici-populina 98AG31]EGG06558.1 hypothetical protein MELLADRAFT_86389 [Melampsora larici-populina 98AG31]
MHLCINLIFFSAALQFLKSLNAVPAGLVHDAVLDVKTNLKYCDETVSLGYDPEVDLGREAHRDYLKRVEKSKPVVIKDIRGSEDQFKWDVHGFAYVKDKVTGLEECKNDQDYDELLSPAAEELVKKITNADAVYAFNSRVRDQEPNSEVVGHSRNPVPSVHSDFSSEGAKEAVEKAIARRGLESNEAKEFKAFAQDDNNRIVIIHLWRPLQVVKRDPLALCDWRSVEIENAHAYRPRGPGRCACVQWRFNPKNKWYYLSQQAPEEVAMFVQYDSAAEGHMTLPHASFEESNAKASPARKNVEQMHSRRDTD